MSRIVFYIVVSFLAFGIGSFIAIKFYWSSSSTITVIETPTENKIVEQNANGKVSEARFICEDEAVKTIWDKLEKDSNFIEDAYYVIEARQIKNCQELFNIQLVELNGDKSDEFIIKGNEILFFNSGGNFPAWIVSRFDDEYKIIFDGIADFDEDGIKTLDKKKHNFKNLKIKKPNGWESDNFGFFEFDGKEYKIKKCVENVNSAYDYDNIRGEKLISVKPKRCL